MTAIVYSFHRSGTYYLCSLLKSRFYPTANMTGPLPKYLDTITGGEVEGTPGRYRPDKPLPFSGWGDEKGRDCNWKRLFGGHLCHPIKNIFKRGREPIYLIRDGKDVMVSLWRLRNKVRNDHVEFLHWYYHFFPRREVPYDFPDGTPIPGLWWWATQTWQKYASRVLIVYYEDLMRDKEGTLNEIGEYLGLTKGPPREEEEKRVGIAPNPGETIGRWYDYFDTAELEYWQECGAIAKRLVANGGKQWPKPNSIQ